MVTISPRGGWQAATGAHDKLNPRPDALKSPAGEVGLFLGEAVCKVIERRCSRCGYILDTRSRRSC